MSDDQTSIYAWQVYENGQWGMIGALLPGQNMHGPLMGRNRDIVQEGFRHLAERHHNETGCPIRFARYGFSGVLEAQGVVTEVT